MSIHQIHISRYSQKKRIDGAREKSKNGNDEIFGDKKNSGAENYRAEEREKRKRVKGSGGKGAGDCQAPLESSLEHESSLESRLDSRFPISLNLARASSPT